MLRVVEMINTVLKWRLLESDDARFSRIVEEKLLRGKRRSQDIRVFVQLRFDEMQLRINSIRLHFILSRSIAGVTVPAGTVCDHPSTCALLVLLELQFDVEMISEQLHVRYLVAIMRLQDSYLFALYQSSSYQIEDLDLFAFGGDHTAIQERLRSIHVHVADV